MELGVVDRRGFPRLRAGLLDWTSLSTRFISVSVKVSKGLFSIDMRESAGPASRTLFA